MYLKELHINEDEKWKVQYKIYRIRLIWHSYKWWNECFRLSCWCVWGLTLKTCWWCGVTFSALMPFKLNVLLSSHGVYLTPSPQSRTGPFVALGSGWKHWALVSFGVTNVVRQRQGDRGQLGSGPPPHYLPTTCAAVRGPSGPNLLLWREGFPKSSWCAPALLFNVFIYCRQRPHSISKCVCGGALMTYSYEHCVFEPHVKLPIWRLSAADWR